MHQQTRCPNCCPSSGGRLFSSTYAPRNRNSCATFHCRATDCLHHLLSVTRARIIHQARETFFPAQGDPEAPAVAVRYRGWHLTAVIFWYLQRFTQPPPSRRRSLKLNGNPIITVVFLSADIPLVISMPSAQQANRHRPEDARQPGASRC